MIRRLDIAGLPADVAVALAWAGAGEEPPLCALAEAETDRLAAFAHPDRRRQFVLGRTAARGLLAERMSCSPEAAPLVVAPGGAVGVRGAPFHLSISHASAGGAALAVAVVASRPVGVDLERAVPRHPGLLARILAEQEEGIPRALGGDPAVTAALVWALKEAVLKGMGTGLRFPSRNVRLQADGTGSVWADARGERWSLHHARVDAFWLAVAVRTAFTSDESPARPARF